MAPPSTPRTPHPTPTMSSRYVGSNSTRTTSSSSSSSTKSSEYSYFFASAPNTASPNPDITRPPFTAPVPHAHHQLHTHSTDITKPIITCSVTSTTNSFAHQGASYHPQYYHTHPPPAPSDALRQFALHIPNPPQLTMPPNLTGRQLEQSSLISSSGSSDSQHQHRPLQSPQSRHSESISPSSSPQAPDMTCCTEQCQYLLVVSRLPPTITSNMVTISANKGDRLRVNAQAWGGENAGKLSINYFPPFSIFIFICSPFRVANFFSAARCGPFKGPGKI